MAAKRSLSLSSCATRVGSFFRNILLVVCLLVGNYVSYVASFVKSSPFSRLRGNEMFQTAATKTATASNVCVVGGGFGGLYTAIGLAQELKSSGSNVYLIDPKTRFVFLPLLYELAVGKAPMSEVAPLFDDLLTGSGVKHIRGSVDDIDFERKVCIVSPSASVSQPFELKFDKIVLAPGNQPRLDTIPGAADYALPFYRLDDCLRLKSKLSHLKRVTGQRKVKVAIVGAGYSGIELATNIAEFLGESNVELDIIDRGERILATAADFNRLEAERALKKRNISMRFRTSVKEVTVDGLSLVDSGKEIFLKADLVMLTAGSEQSALTKKLNLPKSSAGRVLVRDTLQCVGNSDAFCIGDSAAIDSGEVPPTAQVAMQQSGTVVYNVVQSVRGNAGCQRKFRFVSLGEMLSLGSLNATMSSLGGYVRLNGPLAAISRRAVYALRMPTFTQKAKALVTATSTTFGTAWSKVFKSEH